MNPLGILHLQRPSTTSIAFKPPAVISIVSLSAIVMLALSCCAGCGERLANPPAISDELRDESIAKLRAVMESQERWVKVHAAESLVELGFPQGVTEAFGKELTAHGDEPEYRVGIWRVLAKASSNSRERSKWVQHIKDAFFDESSPDRVHAVETLAKLGVALKPDEIEVVKKAAASDNLRLQAYSQWLLAVSDNEHRASHRYDLVKLLDSPAAETRGIAAYALRHVGALDSNLWKGLLERAKGETEPRVKQRLYGAAMVAVPLTVNEMERDALRAEALSTAASGDIRSDLELARILADVGQLGDLPLLTTFLRTSNSPGEATAQADAADLSAAAANAILRIERRHNHQALR